MRRPLDLRHVISPGLRDLVELANTDDFDRVTEQVRDLRGCTRPVNLHGWTITTDQTTKQVIRSYRSEDEPSGRLLTTCGNRRASRCPACSRLYAADTYHLIKLNVGLFIVGLAVCASRVAKLSLELNQLEARPVEPGTRTAAYLGRARHADSGGRAVITSRTEISFGSRAR